MSDTERDTDTEDTPEQAEYRAGCRSWLQAHATPRGATDRWAIQGYVEESQAQASFDRGRAWQGALYDAGYAGQAWPAEYGGGGGPGWMTRIFNEEAANFEENSGFIASTIAMLGPTLLRHASEEQKSEYLPDLLSGRKAFCQLFSEPGAGSDLAGLGARAVRDGDEFVVNGQKVWNSAAQFCDWGFLLVRTDPDVPKHQGITFLLVDMASPGIEVRPLVQSNGAAHFNEVFLTDVRIPVANVVGAIDGGWGPARTVLSNESAFIGRGGVDTSSNLIELARRFGRDQDPLVRQGLADYHTRQLLQGLMGEVIQAAVRKGEAPPIDGSLIKLYAAASKVKAGNLAMMICGAAGAAGNDPAAAWSRGEVVNRYSISIGGGTNEVQRNNLSERVLGLPREPRVDKDVAWKDIPR
ncbi:MAG: acyl-CoA dehydrogenase family protein [Acidimicrobiales bacterium]|nr:acyl-CoA dehydrogenase family protein [Acidimicrobiales bacterium]